jgi:hypothetical protein
VPGRRRQLDEFEREQVERAKRGKVAADAIGNPTGAPEDSITLAMYRSYLMVEPPSVDGVKPTSLFEFYLRHGRWFTPLDTLPKGVRRGTPRACWYNGQMLALTKPDRFAYAEGYAVSSGDLPFPIHHGWVIERASGRAVELTWQRPGLEYIGVPIRYEFLREHFNRDGGSLFDFNRAVQRAIVGETPLGEMVLPLDAWLLPLPGEENPTESHHHVISQTATAPTQRRRRNRESRPERPV